MAITGFLKKEDAIKGGVKPGVALRTWYTDRYESMLLQRNMLAAILGIALTGIIICAIAVYIIYNSKSIEPFVIEISESANISTLVDQASLKELINNKYNCTIPTGKPDPKAPPRGLCGEWVLRYFVGQYVMTRESYDVNTLQEDYFRVVRLFSTADAYRDFISSIDQSNPNSVILKLGSSMVRQVEIKSIQFLKGNRAQVRFKAMDFGQTGGAKASYDQIATLRYDFFNLALETEDSFVNPIGLQVIEYKVGNDSNKVEKETKEATPPSAE